VLKNKVAIITGAGSGIGRATAEFFAREGAKVVAADWNKSSGGETAAEIASAGGEALFCHTDVSISSQVEALVGKTVEHFGRLDILVNNAAIQILSTLVETSEADWDRIQSVNLKGAFLACK